MPNLRPLTLIIFLFCIAMAGGQYIAYAQVPEGQVLGVVADSTGATVPGANVRLENELTGIGEAMVTDATGIFTFTRLNSGVYRLTVEKAGFKTGVYPGIQVQVAEKSHPTVQEWFNTACFVAPAAGTVGNSGNGILFGPSSFNADFALYKSFTLHENVNLQFRCEMFDVFNHPNLGPPNTTLNGFDFGQITSISTQDPSQAPRVIQLALWLTF